MGLFNFFKKPTTEQKTYNSDSKHYKFDTLEHINSIPVPTEKFEFKCDFTQSVEYVLQRKATEHKQAGNMELAIACLKKSNQIMPFSPMHYSTNDYMRLVRYLRATGKFDEAHREEEKILGKTKEAQKEAKKQTIERAKDSASSFEDKPLIHVLRENRICGECAKYHDRIYSVDGIDNRFPDYRIFEQYYANKSCSCSLMNFPFVLDISIMRGKGETNPVQYSNREFTDDRSPEEIECYDNYIKKMQEEQKNRHDFEWLQENLPSVAPKSLSGYMKMRNSNSTNYQKLVALAKEKGYDI